MFGQYSFTRPSFVDGMGRLFDFASIYNNCIPGETNNMADAIDILSDWNYVGQDLKKAIEAYDKANEQD
jgi:hypothetical protein